MRKPAVVCGVLATVFAGLFVAAKVREKSHAPTSALSKASNQTKDLVAAKELFRQGKYDETLEIIQRNKQEMERFTENGVGFLELFIATSQAARDVPQLVVLFEFFPELFKENEGASLLVADSYINDNRIKEYQKIRSLWEDRETQVAAWYLLDADAFLLEGRRKDALDLLKSRTFKDKADVGRLIRLALLQVEDDPKVAWRYLGEAYAKDPQNVDIRTYRARLLESVGKSTLAEGEYKAAIKHDRENVFLKDQLAEFYLRQKRYPQALDVWKENLAPPSLDTIWVKALFWSKVTAPLSVDVDQIPPPQGRLEPFVQYLADLRQNQFWNEKKFDRLAKNSYYLQNCQETFWLRLLSELQQKNEKQAFQLLKYNPFTAVSWYPELELALKRVLNYRSTGTLELKDSLAPLANLLHDQQNEKPLPAFFALLEKYAATDNEGIQGDPLPEDLKALLKSSEIFSAIFLAAQWYEAGLELHQLPIIPSEFPDWVAYNITEALQKNRTKLDALEFASLQQPTPELTLLTAEMMITTGDPELALGKLNKLAKLDSDIGFRSAWLAALIYMEKKEWKAAKNSIISQPKLVRDVSGKETLARIALQEGDTSLADKLYASIEKSSPEARSYLAKKAYAEKKWDKAKELTEKLIRDYPDNPLLKKNLEKIVEQQQKQKNRNNLS